VCHSLPREYLMRKVPLAFLLSLAAGPALAQSNAALMANDHYTRSHDYDLVHQRIVVSDFDWDSTSFRGGVTTTLVALRPGLDSLILDEGALLENTAVTDRRGTALRTARHGDTLVVFPAAPLGFGDTLVFAIAYRGKVRNGRGLTYVTTDGLPHRPRQIWSQGEDHNNHYWFPTYDFPSDKMTWELVATVPREDMAISNGRPVSDVRRGATRTLTWRQDTPSATYLVSLIVAPLVKIHDSWKGIPVDYYVYRDDSAKAWRLFHVTPDMIDTYSTLTGVRYPWAKYAQTTVADFFGGMENVSATTLVDWLPDRRAYQDRPWYQWLLIPHELAHMWFGDYVTTINWANMWLNEGFAEFMPGQYWGRKLGAHAAQDYYAGEYDDYMRIERQRSMPLASLGSNNIYPKGALVLKMLEDYLGPERFWASIHRYLEDHAFGVATTDDLRQAVLEATGQNLDWFWSQWMYQAGYPRFDVAASYDSTQHALTLTVKQTQDTLLPDTAVARPNLGASVRPESSHVRFTVPAVFRMPLEIRVGTAAGDVTQRVEVDAREQTVTIPNVRSAPTMVVFDDGNRVLKSLHFEQPTAWLATELRRDADLWDRRWVIEQLAARTSDPAAGAALADAAEHADYYLTRVDALRRLGAFPGQTAMPAVTVALADTSAAVRAAAVGALARVGGVQAAALARSAWTGDSSYEVRAAAVTALVELDSAGARATIAAALATPSYRDTIQDAALRAIALRNDTAFIPEVDALTGRSRTSLRVLAALAAQGSAHAFNLLAAHLDGPRRAVRGWALQAIRSELPRPFALEALRAVVDGLTHPDTKRAVQDAIKQLEEQPAR
jgi:aminopeptidase N